MLLKNLLNVKKKKKIKKKKGYINFIKNKNEILLFEFVIINFQSFVNE